MLKAANVCPLKSVYCFDKARRLLKKSDYDEVFNQAKKLVTPDFVVLYRNNSIGHSRLGLALSKKMIAKAHDRNQVKRMFRETFRLQHLPAIDVVILARKGATKAENSISVAKLNELWGKLCGK